MRHWLINGILLVTANLVLGGAAGALGVAVRLEGASGLLVATAAAGAFGVGLLDAWRTGAVMPGKARAALALVTLAPVLAVLWLVLDRDPIWETLVLRFGAAPEAWRPVLMGVLAVLCAGVTFFTLAGGARTWLVHLEVKRLEEERAAMSPPPLLTDKRQPPAPRP